MPAAPFSKHVFAIADDAIGRERMPSQTHHKRIFTESRIILITRTGRSGTGASVSNGDAAHLRL